MPRDTLITHSTPIAQPKARYWADPEKKRVAARAGFKKYIKGILKRARKYYYKHRAQRCAYMRGRYELAEPQLYIRESYANTLHTKLLCELIHAFDEELLKKIKGSIRKVVVLSKILQVRKQYAGSLLHTIRSINNLEIKQNGDFGEGSHKPSSEPYYYMTLLTSSRMHPLTWL